MSTIAAGARLGPRKLFALRALYLYTVIGAGVMGAWILFAPSRFLAAFGLPEGDPFLLGIVGATETTFAICAVLGLRTPVRFAPLILFQLVYKTLWLAIVFAPPAVHGAAPASAWTLALVFASYVAFDLVALPYAQLTADET